MSRKWFWAWLAALCLVVTVWTAPNNQPQTVNAATKTYTFGTDVTYPPFEFANKHNVYVGIDIDLIRPSPRRKDLRSKSRSWALTPPSNRLKRAKSTGSSPA